MCIKKIYRPEVAINIWSYLFLIFIYSSCGYSNNEIEKSVKLLENRFASNSKVFDSLRFLTNEKYNTENFGLTYIVKSDSVSFSLKKKIEKLKIEKLEPFLSNSGGVGLDISFTDCYEPTLYISYFPGFDTLKNIGRNPLRKIIWQDNITKDAWIIKQTYP